MPGVGIAVDTIMLRRSPLAASADDEWLSTDNIFDRSRLFLGIVLQPHHPQIGDQPGSEQGPPRPIKPSRWNM